MKEAVKIAIAEKVKEKAIKCYKIHKTSQTDCEEQYVEFYKHALNFFGCEITRNSGGRYLAFIVSNPEKLGGSINECVSTWMEKKQKNIKMLIY